MKCGHSCSVVFALDDRGLSCRLCSDFDATVRRLEASIDSMQLESRHAHSMHVSTKQRLESEITRLEDALAELRRVASKEAEETKRLWDEHAAALEVLCRPLLHTYPRHSHDCDATLILSSHVCFSCALCRRLGRQPSASGTRSERR